MLACPARRVQRSDLVRGGKLPGQRAAQSFARRPGTVVVIGEGGVLTLLDVGVNPGDTRSLGLHRVMRPGHGRAALSRR
jgi:hypothetical protein